ncbi:TetR/AcrR family transcriptional regulator [Nocardia goodfellowii]
MPAASKPPVTPKNVDDTIESRILDAALTQFELVGFKKTTVEDVARRAGVDRVTVYRRVGSRDDLVQAVVSREVGRVLAELAQLPARHDDAGDLVAEMFVTVLTRWRTHALAQRLLTLEPERVIASLTTGGSTAFTMSVAASAAAMEQAIARGLLPEVPDVMTRMEIACRVVHSFILLPDITVRFESEAEMADFARGYLLPILTA